VTSQPLQKGNAGRRSLTGGLITQGNISLSPLSRFEQAAASPLPFCLSSSRSFVHSSPSHPPSPLFRCSLPHHTPLLLVSVSCHADRSGEKA
jgi:hypothetical protein